MPFGNKIETVIVQGRDELLADAWYGDNKVMKVMFNQGYIPIVKLNRKRYRGYL